MHIYVNIMWCTGMQMQIYRFMVTIYHLKSELPQKIRNSKLRRY